MGSTLVFFGGAILAILSLWFFVKLRDQMLKEKNAQLNLPEYIEYKQDPFTIIFIIFSFSMFLFSVFLMSKAAYEEYDYCNTMPVNATVTGNLTQYDYERICYDNTNSSDDGIIGISNAWIIFTMIMFLAIIFIVLYKWVIKVYEGYQKNE